MVIPTSAAPGRREEAVEADAEDAGAEARREHKQAVRMAALPADRAQVDLLRAVAPAEAPAVVDRVVDLLRPLKPRLPESPSRHSSTSALDLKMDFPCFPPLRKC
jgi:hypothetical protein